jgi:hypothetical protein
LVTPKAGAKHELLLIKPASGTFVYKLCLLKIPEKIGWLHSGVKFQTPALSNKFGAKIIFREIQMNR